MDKRERTPLRRELHADLKAWPAALVVVLVYLALAKGTINAPEAMTTAPPSLGSYTDIEVSP